MLKFAGEAGIYLNIARRSARSTQFSERLGVRDPKECLNCEEYAEPRKMRHRTAKTNMILVEGV
jgi:uncharacterized protein (DUF1330 family)